MKLLYPLAVLSALFLFSCSKDLGSDKASGAPDAAFSGPGSGGSNGPGNNQPGVITAGEWNDLTHWNFWLGLQDKEVFNVVKSDYRYDLANKVSVRLLSSGNQPLIDERVLLKRSGITLWETRTDNKGIAQLFTGKEMGSSSFDIYLPSRNFTATGAYSKDIKEYIVPSATSDLNNADIAFVVDATGSMGDEISYLKTELLDVINRVKSAHPGMALRTGSVFYRDEGDEYVTRKSDFTGNSKSTIDFISDQKADGGGDFPEAVHSAVKETVEELNWSAKARSRILFLVLDAPPHDDVNVMATLKNEVMAAARKGIRIVPVTASGIDKYTEYLMRQTAIATNGTYVFITNHSGIGNDHLEPTVGEYEVEFLNNLMVRLIKEYLN